MKYLLGACALFIAQLCAAQKTFTESINQYQTQYINTHEVVKGDDRKHLHFYAPDSSYRVSAIFEKINDAVGFKMPTTARSMQQYYRYGKISFKIKDSTCQLVVYQSKDLIGDEFKDYLFIPFTDATNGTDTYEGGRYIDALITDITNNTLVVDFNKAYNPYCCYTTGYHCPIPPKENALTVAILAGEKKYTKPVH